MQLLKIRLDAIYGMAALKRWIWFSKASIVCFIAASTSFATTEHVTCALCASFVCPESQPPTCHSPDLSNEASKERGREGEAGCVRLWVWLVLTFNYDKGTWYTVYSMNNMTILILPSQQLTLSYVHSPLSCPLRFPTHGPHFWRRSWEQLLHPNFFHILLWDGASRCLQPSYSSLSNRCFRLLLVPPFTLYDSLQPALQPISSLMVMFCPQKIPCALVPPNPKDETWELPWFVASENKFQMENCTA